MICDLTHLKLQISLIINILMAESIYSPNFISPTTFHCGNLPNINLTKYSPYTVYTQIDTIHTIETPPYLDVTSVMITLITVDSQLCHVHLLGRVGVDDTVNGYGYTQLLTTVHFSLQLSSISSKMIICNPLTELIFVGTCPASVHSRRYQYISIPSTICVRVCAR